MMEIPLFQVDAFTDEVFGGNSAAVCVLPGYLDPDSGEGWIAKDLMQNVAMENNLAETAFCIKDRHKHSERHVLNCYSV